MHIFHVYTIYIHFHIKYKLAKNCIKFLRMSHLNYEGIFCTRKGIPNVFSFILIDIYLLRSSYLIRKK